MLILITFVIVAVFTALWSRASLFGTLTLRLLLFSILLQFGFLRIQNLALMVVETYEVKM